MTTPQENVAQLTTALKDLMTSDEKLQDLRRDVVEKFLRKESAKGALHLPTAFGKTRIMAMMAVAHLCGRPDTRVIVAVPRTNLIAQHMGVFREYKQEQDETRAKKGLPPIDIPNMSMGRYDAFRKDLDARIIFTTYMSLKKLKERLTERGKHVGMVLLDEAHNGTSAPRRDVVDSFPEDVLIYGYTATLGYTKERNVEKLLGEVLASVSIEDAITTPHQILSGFKNILLNFDVDLSNVSTADGDFNMREYRQALAKAFRGKIANSGNENNWEEAHRKIAHTIAMMYRDFVDEDVGPLMGKKCLIHCRSQREAEIQAEEFNKLFRVGIAGIYTTKHDDPEVLNAFKSGALPVLCQVGKLNEGFDMGPLQVIFEFPTASWVLAAQRGGRSLRLDQSKDLALIIDLAYCPTGKNPYDSRQVFFCDVAGRQMVLPKDKALKGAENTGKRYPRVPERYIDCGMIISDISELMRLSQEAKAAAAARFIPPMRPGMLTSVELGKEYEIAPSTGNGYLKEAYNKKIQFMGEDGKHDLVEFVKRSGKVCLALHESPEARKKFEEMYPDIITPVMSFGMLTSRGLSCLYGFSVAIGVRYLNEMYDHQETFTDATGKTHPLVQWVKNGGKRCLALYDLPRARQKFEELYPDSIVRPLRPGMLTTEGLLKEYETSYRKVKKYLEDAYHQKIQFMEDAKWHDLVEKVKSGPKICLAVHEAPRARQKFEELHPDLLISTPRPGMLTCLGLANEYEISQVTAVKYLEKAKQENLQFVDETGHVHAVVESVKSGPKICLAIHESLFARAVFMAFVQRESQGRVKALSPRLITDQAPYAPKKIEAQAPVQDQHQQE